MVQERLSKEMEHNETGCQAPEAPKLCVNNCGFFGSAATMNMCSKCHKDFVLKQEHAKIASSSIGSILNGSSSNNGNAAAAVAVAVDPQASSAESMVISSQASCTAALKTNCDEVKESPKRCSSCKKRVGLTGFKCRCGNLFCGVHRYSDKHSCPYDYQTAAQAAIAKANPSVKAEKLNKI